METYDPHKTVPEVRQGSRRRMNLRVLVISLIGIVVAFSILFAVSTTIQPGGTGSVNSPGVQPTLPDDPAADPITKPTPGT
jgi:hypothetical protein